MQVGLEAGRHRLIDLWTVTSEVVTAVVDDGGRDDLRRLGCTRRPRIGVTATSSFAAVTPCRLLDTRDDAPGRLVADQTFALQVTDRCGIRAGSSAVALTLTVVDTGTTGGISHGVPG